MNQILSDFFQLGVLRFMSRILMGLRGLYIVTQLSPRELGEYTIWLLFVFYFSIFDLGSIFGVERDLPHYQGSGEKEMYQKSANVGWSTFFTLSVLAACLLGAVVWFKYDQKLLAILLSLTLLSDKCYRAFESFTRIRFQYRDNGVAQLILGSVSLCLVIYLLPRFGVPGIFAGGIAGTTAAMIFLSRRSPIIFEYCFRIKEIVIFIKRAFPLIIVVYSIEFFHSMVLTVLAVRWDTQMLGFFAFAYRIFQIGLSLFPYLIQEVMRTRIYYQIAKVRDRSKDLNDMFWPMGAYCFVTALIWIACFFGADWFIERFAPAYMPASGTLKLLLMALGPLGVVKILSDYLCSPVHKKTGFVVSVWLSGVILQGVILYFVPFSREKFLIQVPILYLFMTLGMYFVIAGRALKAGRSSLWAGLRRSSYLLAPIFISGLLCGFAVYGMKIKEASLGNAIAYGIFSVAVLVGLSWIIERRWQQRRAENGNEKDGETSCTV